MMNHSLVKHGRLYVLVALALLLAWYTLSYLRAEKTFGSPQLKRPETDVYAKMTMPLWLPPDAEFQVTRLICDVDTAGMPALAVRIRHRATGAVIEQVQSIDRFYDSTLTSQQRSALRNGEHGWILLRRGEVNFAYLQLGRTCLRLTATHPAGQRLLQRLFQHYSETYMDYKRALSKIHSPLERELTRTDYDVCEYPNKLEEERPAQ